MGAEVSVIIPAYNAQETIRMCVNALLKQNCPTEKYEVVVVDDGSTDNTGEIIKSFSLSKHIQYIKQENSGPASARNRGVEAAEGSIILFTDSDCVPANEWIVEMTAPFVNPEVMAVKGAYRTKQKSIVARFAQLEFEERFEMLGKAGSTDMVDTYSAGYRAVLFRKLGGFDTSFPVANNEDTELSYRMAKAGHKMVFNPKAVVYHLGHPDSLPEYAKLKFWRGYWRMAVYKRFPNKMLKETYTPQTLKLQILTLLLFTAGIPISVLSPALGVFALLFAAVAFFLLAMPFTSSALGKDLHVGLLAPLFLLLRAASIGLGAIWGAIHPGKNKGD